MRLTRATYAAVLLLALFAAKPGAAFDGDSGSRADKGDSKKSSERTLILPLIALWKLGPLLKTFSGGFTGYGSFGGSFGGGGLYHQPFYPYPGALGIGGYPGAFPGAFPGVGGYPLGPGPFNIRGHDEKPSHQPTIVEDSELGRLEATTTSRPSLAQTFREIASPLFHAGQRVESRGRSN